MTSFGWRAGLADVDRRRIAELIAAAKSADGIAPVGDQVLRELSHDRTRHLLALDDDTVVVGYLDLAPATDEGSAMACSLLSETECEDQPGCYLVFP